MHTVHTSPARSILSRMIHASPFAIALLASQPAMAHPTEAEKPLGSDRPSESAMPAGSSWLLSPTSRDERRPLSADRPDATESPYTLDAGAVQIEISFVEYALDADSDGDTSTLDIAPFNLKLGLTEHADLQILFNPYTQLDTPGSDTDGIGNLTLRLKHNLWGNDRGDFALAIMPLITLPTGRGDLSTDHVEGGVVVPAAWDLSGSWGEGWSVGGQVEIGFVRNDTNTGHDTVLAHTAVLGVPINDTFAAYFEYIGEFNSTSDNYAPALSGGLTYAVDGDTQLDVGLVFGLDNGDTDDVKVFAGLTKRF
ncbi:MAG: hypothetical protein ACI89L_000742 [Phycisphaerales bacterium]|jgi:hypothetical protein